MHLREKPVEFCVQLIISVVQNFIRVFSFGQRQRFVVRPLLLEQAVAVDVTDPQEEQRDPGLLRS